MKKLLSLALALMLLMLCPAMAETAEVAAPAVQTLTSPDGTYSFDVPEDFFPMNSQTMKMLFATEEMQNAIAQAMGLADASQLEVYFEQLEASNMMIVYGPDFVSNLNVITQPSELTMELLTALKDLMDASTISQYVSMGVAEDQINTLEIRKIGDYEWYGLDLIFMGSTMLSRMTFVDGIQYVLTFTGLDAEVAQLVLESFRVGNLSAPASSAANENVATETIGQRNALRSAKDYLNYTAFSREGLIKQLEYEKYAHEDAVYAVDNCGADWNEQALECAKNYLDYTAFSYKGLVKQLEYEGFTNAQAVYGVDRCGADWNEQAVKCAKSYLEYTAFSRQGLIDQLEYEGFTNAQAIYGVTGAGY